MLRFRRLAGSYGVVRFTPETSIPDWALKGEFSSITRTADELSIVCPLQNFPEGMKSSLRWICFKLEGPFAFSQTGVLLSFVQPLSDDGIPIFVISTYETDYVLVQEDFAAAALDILQKAGHEFSGK
jgi:hypothetical protein